MTPDEARKILGDDSANVSEEELQKEIDTATTLKNILFELFRNRKWYNTIMKKHISAEQYNELNEKQKRAAESYYRMQSQPKEQNEKFWTVGRMIEYLDEASMKETISSTNAGWIDIYGFNLSGTPQEDWCDKLWGKVTLRLEEEVKSDPFRFRD